MKFGGFLAVGLLSCLSLLDGTADASPCCGLGVAVAGSLAFAGGVAAAKHHHNHHHGGGCHSCGCGGCGSSCGWCGGAYGKRRRREAGSLTTFLEDAEIQKAYAKIASEDKDECGLRLVCELAQKDPRDLAQDEIQILLPYRGAGPSDGTVYGTYDEAAWHGQEGHNCASNYPLCAFTAQQVMEEYRKYVLNNGTFDL
ncbi:uncharacterized protein LOC122260325 [Penaeus japonicus]|uniref:uncharacterized protein LOC122260325 n=1 Tax=Penaeus japonicus TaxID=27405 RepID=UPI001C70FF95|nr:uncharacterized protein LOC122260325 [Penaeus japonicus]XP_042883482.1 uncharacterized protein LOC122260325 [Penaeus japonicus]